LLAVDLNFSNDFSGGASGTNTVEFSYVFSNFSGVTGLTTSISGGAASDVGLIVGETPGTACTLLAYNSVDCSASGFLDPFPSFTLTGSSSWVAGSLLNGGSVDIDDGLAPVTVTYTYTVPEPAAWLLATGGLAGLALAGRRKWRARVSRVRR
jgi:hypothetical protein